MTVTTEPSNFRKVGEFHTVFEHPIKQSPDVSVFDENPKLVSLRYSLIEEETKEFIEAVENKDVIEMVDALADIDYVVHGAGLAFGINMDTMMQLAVLPKSSDVKPADFFDRTSEAEITAMVANFRTLLVDLKSAFDQKDIMAIAVQFLKIIQTTYEAAAVLGVDLDEAFRLVHDSNMTKACVDEAQARETLENYQKDLSVYKDPAFRRSQDGKYWIIYDRSTGKTLKNKYYKAVDLRPLVLGN